MTKTASARLRSAQVVVYHPDGYGPSPTADATLFTEPCLMSPVAKTPCILASLPGIGTDNVATLLIVVGDNHQRLGSEA